LVVILEPWKGPSYTRWNTPFAVEEHQPRPKSKGDNHPVVKEVMVTTSWEEAELQPEALEDESFLEECEDNFNIIQPVPKEKKPY
jgi:hypothetical protein